MPTTALPDHCRSGLADMLSDLMEHQLVVEALPAPEQRHSGHKVRVVVDQNPQWYQDFTARYEKRRAKPRNRSKPDTRIYRSDMVRLLTNWLKHGYSRSSYAPELLEIACDYVTEYAAPEPPTEEELGYPPEWDLPSPSTDSDDDGVPW